ncbi:hypothetical protein ASD88_09480 [Pelomonas sp. Root662]|nr:hypothetical protein ASC81_09480 [Pelomonas sp. Root405]KRA73660.1 hypothetical protein ASD88_09480 [Pelomonas sp. Root662]
MLSVEVRWALLTRAVQGCGALLAVVCVVRGYNLEVQGLFFTFLSLAALIQLGEFGVGYASLQMAGHLRARGEVTAAVQLRHQARWRGLTWLTCVGGFTGVAVAVWLPVSVTHCWLGPWCALVVSAAAMQMAQLELYWLEGARSVGLAWRLRFAQEVLGACVFVGSLWMGGGLWALAMYFAVRAAVPMLWWLQSRTGGRTHGQVAQAAGRFSWGEQLWPFQWRIGLSALAGFLVFQALNPLLLLSQGAAATARFGIALAAMNMLLLFSTAWPLSQSARFAVLLAQGDLAGLRRRLAHLLLPSLALALVAALLALAAVAGLLQRAPALAERLPDLGTLGLLLMAGLAHHATACYAVVLRADRLEPLLRLNVIGGLAGLALVAAVARMGDLPLVAATHLGCTLVGLLIAWRHYRRLLQRPA